MSRYGKLFGRIAAITAACTTVPSIAHAHFTLDNPPSWMSQDALGGPQKESPCGNEAGGTPSGAVTAYQPGETITVKWTEIIAHDGWFRIALSSANRADLMDPPYQLDSSGNSVDAGIENPPVAPVLVDGLYPHTAASLNGRPKSYSYSLTLPMAPCSMCTLQVIQIMLDHPNNVPYGYTYHHCADISIGADGGLAGSDASVADSNSDGSAAAAPEAGANASNESAAGTGARAGSSSGSCGCSLVGLRRTPLLGLAGLVTLAGLVRRRRGPLGSSPAR